MARRIRPSKPQAVFGAVGGAVILTVGIVAFALGDMEGPVWFLPIWVAFGLAVIGFNLWSAFGRNGHIYTVEDR